MGLFRRLRPLTAQIKVVLPSFGICVERAAAIRVQRNVETASLLDTYLTSDCGERSLELSDFKAQTLGWGNRKLLPVPSDGGGGQFGSAELRVDGALICSKERDSCPD